MMTNDDLKMVQSLEKFSVLLALKIHFFFFSFKISAFEVNFMDDVGQTLLNWASAFGTQEMVS